MSESDVTELGPYTAGEIPEPWVHVFADNDGVPINLTGYTVRLTTRLNSGAQTVRNGTLVDGPAGEAGYTWVEGDTDDPGVLEGELVVGNGTYRYARSWRMILNAPLGGTIPDI